MQRPIKKAVLDLTEGKLGLQMISLVEDPAIQIHWITMDAQKPFQLAIQDEEQRIFFTPVLIPGQKIFRSINGEEFDLVFDEDTILKTQLKWTQDNLSGTVDIDHSQKLIPGVTFFESVILNANRFPEAKGFEGLPLGTWMLTGKVNSDEVWKKIKSKEVNGVSIDGLFKTMNVQAATQIKLTEVKVANDNSLFVNGAIAVGSEVYYNRPQIVLIDGKKSEMKNLVWENNITLEDGTNLILAEGKIIEIPKRIQATAQYSDQELKNILSHL